MLLWNRKGPRRARHRGRRRVYGGPDLALRVGLAGGIVVVVVSAVVVAIAVALGAGSTVLLQV